MPDDDDNKGNQFQQIRIDVLEVSKRREQGSTAGERPTYRTVFEPDWLKRLITYQRMYVECLRRTMALMFLSIKNVDFALTTGAIDMELDRFVKTQLATVHATDHFAPLNEHFLSERSNDRGGGDLTTAQFRAAGKEVYVMVGFEAYGHSLRSLRKASDAEGLKLKASIRKRAYLLSFASRVTAGPPD
ncbi:hypothetical protein BDW74DRAFT_183248 [Aspergillus multicolor]|uniref:uncharacterized protein n=1 Tax=Aspergillus multicolor TaxID=41759 RepID=UPI003CCCB827